MNKTLCNFSRQQNIQNIDSINSNWIQVLVSTNISCHIILYNTLEFTRVNSISIHIHTKQRYFKQIQPQTDRKNQIIKIVQYKLGLRITQ